MPKVSITEGAKLAGISRQHLYKKYLTPGIISVEKDVLGNKHIDTSDLLRVFGRLVGDSVDSQHAANSSHHATHQNDSRNTALETEVHLLREQQASAAEREKWLQSKIDQLTDQLATATRLLEHKAQAPPPEPKKKHWSRFLMGG